jgi:hypothetical protein
MTINSMSKIPVGYKTQQITEILEEKEVVGMVGRGPRWTWQPKGLFRLSRVSLTSEREELDIAMVLVANIILGAFSKRFRLVEPSHLITVEVWNFGKESLKTGIIIQGDYIHIE